MGWKTLKEHYRIKHYVCVTTQGICIGSGYVHDLIVVSMEGTLKKVRQDSVNEDINRYQAEMVADPAKLKEVVLAKDTFARALTVYTYDGGKIIENKCEELGWPNVTHDGCMMYANTFSEDKLKVVRLAKRDAAAGIELLTDTIQRQKEELAERERRLVEYTAQLKHWDVEYPEVSRE
jgi:hypothetical protein